MSTGTRPQTGFEWGVIGLLFLVGVILIATAAAELTGVYSFGVLSDLAMAAYLLVMALWMVVIFGSPTEPWALVGAAAWTIGGITRVPGVTQGSTVGQGVHVAATAVGVVALCYYGIVRSRRTS